MIKEEIVEYNYKDGTSVKCREMIVDNRQEFKHLIKLLFIPMCIESGIIKMFDIGEAMREWTNFHGSCKSLGSFSVSLIENKEHESN